MNIQPLLAGRFRPLAEDLDLTSFEGFVRLAVRARATDIHLEPLPEHLRVRVRIEGSLQELAHVPYPPSGNRPHPLLHGGTAAGGAHDHGWPAHLGGHHRGGGLPWPPSSAPAAWGNRS